MGHLIHHLQVQVIGASESDQADATSPPSDLGSHLPLPFCIQMLPHLSVIEAFQPVQAAYTEVFRQMMQVVLKHLNDELEVGVLPSA